MKVKQLFIEKKAEKGQALITMIFFIIIAVSVLSVSALILASSIQNSSITEQGLLTYSAAESGAEDGILHLLRNSTIVPIPSYTVGDVQVAVSISVDANHPTNNTITSTATIDSTVRKIQIQTTRTNGVLSVVSWREI